MDEPAFGTFRPSPLQAWLITRSRALKRNKGLGRAVMSLGLRLAGLRNKDTVIDVAVFESERARLRPHDNLSDKRVLATPQFWDAAERRRLWDAVAKGPKDRPFLFVDIGANAGFYSLFMRAAARAFGRKLRVVAVEPDPHMRARLMFNLEASRALSQVVVLPWAATETAGMVQLYTNPDNRGQNSVIDTGSENAIDVEGHPIIDILYEASPDHPVDALKIDIEGAELPALRGMFATVVDAFWPRLIVMEAKADGVSNDALDLCLDHGYEVDLSTRMNVVLRLPEETA